MEEWQVMEQAAAAMVAMAATVETAVAVAGAREGCHAHSA